MFHKLKKVLMGVAALAALAVGGSAIASAASSKTTTDHDAKRVQLGVPVFTRPGSRHRRHEDAEKPVTGDAVLLYP